MPGIGGRSPEFDVESVLRLSPGHRAILDLVSAHPFLSTTEIGRFLGWEPFMAELCIDDLLRWQLLRVLGPGEAACLRPDDELLETTLAGLRVMAAQHGVSMAFAARGEAWRAAVQLNREDHGGACYGIWPIPAASTSSSCA